MHNSRIAERCNLPTSFFGRSILVMVAKERCIALICVSIVLHNLGGATLCSGKLQGFLLFSLTPFKIAGAKNVECNYCTLNFSYILQEMILTNGLNCIGFPNFVVHCIRRSSAFAVGEWFRVRWFLLPNGGNM